MGPHFDGDALDLDEPACTFTLGGQVWSVRSTASLPFHFVERLYDREPAQDGQALLQQVREFYSAVLVPSEVEPFFEMLKVTNIVSTKHLTNITQFVWDSIIGGGPTQATPRSSGGRKNTGKKSGVALSSQVTPQAQSA